MPNEEGGSGTNAYLTTTPLTIKRWVEDEGASRGRLRRKRSEKTVALLSTCLWVGRLASMDVQAKPCTLVAQSQR